MARLITLAGALIGFAFVPLASFAGGMYGILSWAFIDSTRQMRTLIDERNKP